MNKNVADSTSTPEESAVEARLVRAGANWRQMALPEAAARTHLAEIQAEGRAASASHESITVAAIPVTPPASISSPSLAGRRRTIIAAVAIAALVVALSAVLFPALQHQRMQSVAATATAIPYPHTFPAHVNALRLAMMTPDDGWATAIQDVTTALPADKQAPNEILHYHAQQWTVALVEPHQTFTAITMLSASEGWATAFANDSRGYTQSELYHYTGTAWQPVALPAFSGTYGVYLNRIHVLGPDDVLCDMVLEIGKPQSVPVPGVPPGDPSTVLATGGPYASLVLHFDHGNWQAGPRITDHDPVSAISMTSADDGWAVMPSLPPHAGEGPVRLYHFTQGSWQMSLAPVTGIPTDLALRATDDGWLTVLQANGAFATLHFDGTRWQVIYTTTPPLVNSHLLTATVLATGPGEAWEVISAKSAGISIVVHVFANETDTFTPLPDGFAPFPLSTMTRDSLGNLWLIGVRGQPPTKPYTQALLTWHNGAWVVLATG